MRWRFILDNETLPKLNLAREEAIFQARQQGISRDTLRLWRNNKSVIVGCFGHAESEINLDECERRNVQVVRRTSGGGAVYHDLGNLNFSATFNASTFLNSEDILRIYETFCNAIIAGLSTVGVTAEFHAPNSILLNGDKISGLAIHKTFSACLVHGTLLVDVDLETLHQVLRNIKEDVSNLSDTYPHLTVDDVGVGIIRGFRSALGINLESEELTDNEIQKTDKLLRLKYGNDLWNLRVPSS